MMADAMTSMETCISLVNAVSAAVVPFAVIFFGVKLSKSIEKIKTQVAKELNWQTFWADEFIKTTQIFNENLSSLVVQLQRAAQGRGCAVEIERTAFEITRSNWVLRSIVFAAPLHGPTAVESTDLIIKLIEEIKRTNHIDMDLLLSRQQEFLKSSMSAHREMLGLEGSAE